MAACIKIIISGVYEPPKKRVNTNCLHTAYILPCLNKIACMYVTQIYKAKVLVVTITSDGRTKQREHLQEHRHTRKNSHWGGQTTVWLGFSGDRG